METLRLAAIRFFADLPEDELAAVASMASEEEIAPGQLLAAEGRTGYSLYAIESGTADVIINGETVATIGAGDVVGEMAVLISPPDWSAPPEVAIGGLRTASVVATSSMRLIMLFKRDVWALDRRAPVMIQRLRAVLDERRAQNAERAPGNQRAQSEQGGSPGADKLADNA
jgi:CRP/FNR family transcriptional regulator, cyclic AMP receptor protein